MTTWVTRYQEGEASLNLNNARDYGVWDAMASLDHMHMRRENYKYVLTAVEFVGPVSAVVLAITSVVSWYTHISRVTTELLRVITTRCIYSHNDIIINNNNNNHLTAVCPGQPG